ncbi:CDP-alcohol phosphatidyltransferase family protein [Candidatus Saccharibacteria bacterium]|nr:MAG: CDP-alcohol phosphatidyltransferase family protein [Candidatus Saccharibacteria bacterium]
MIFALRGKVSYGFVCLMIAGICDIFDGTVARHCKRTEDEKLSVFR